MMNLCVGCVRTLYVDESVLSVSFVPSCWDIVPIRIFSHQKCVWLSWGKPATVELRCPSCQYCIFIHVYIYIYIICEVEFCQKLKWTSGEKKQMAVKKLSLNIYHDAELFSKWDWECWHVRIFSETECWHVHVRQMRMLALMYTYFKCWHVHMFSQWECWHVHIFQQVLAWTHISTSENVGMCLFCVLRARKPGKS